jgi:hypothetical protein
MEGFKMIDCVLKAIPDMSDESLSKLRDAAAQEIMKRYFTVSSTERQLNEDEKSLLNEGDRLECMRRYRERTKQGLKETMNAINYYTSQKFIVCQKL